MSILLCLRMSLDILHLISNPDCLVAPVMDFLFIIIAVTASNLTDFAEKAERESCPFLLREGHGSRRKLSYALCVLRARPYGICKHSSWDLVEQELQPSSIPAGQTQRKVGEREGGKNL